MRLLSSSTKQCCARPSALILFLIIASALTAKPVQQWKNTSYLPPQMEAPLAAVGIRHCLWGDGTYNRAIGTLVGDRKTVLSVGHGLQKLSRVSPNHCTFTLFSPAGVPIFSAKFNEIKTANPPEIYGDRLGLSDWGIGTLDQSAPDSINPISVVCSSSPNIAGSKNFFIVTYRKPNSHDFRKLVTTELSISNKLGMSKILEHNGNTLPEDSGAPVLLLRNNGIPYLIAVHGGAMRGMASNWAQLLDRHAAARIRAPLVFKDHRLVPYAGGDC